MSKVKGKSLKPEVPTSPACGDSQILNLRKILKSDECVFGETPWFLHTGHYGLDYIVSGIIDGSGGYPGGKVVEVFGPRSTGKTLLMMMAVKQIQDIGGLAIVADVERRWNKEFCIHHGIDWERLVGWSPETVEEFTVNLMDSLEELPDDGKILVCLDSLASLTTTKEVEDKGIKADQGRKAQRIKAAMRVLPAVLSRKGAVLLVANHIIDKPGVAYGPTYTTPGGQGVPFQATVRIELFRSLPIKLEDKDRPIGVTMRILCDKNSQTAPFGQTTIDMLWARGINKYSGLLDLAKDLGIINVAGGWLEYRGNKYREKELYSNIVEDEEFRKEFFSNEAWKQPYFLVGE